MQVWLKNPWFVGGHRYRRSVSKEDLRTVPDEFFDNVPTTAKVVVKPGEPEEPEEGSKEPDAATVATRTYKDAAHANDGDSLPGGTDDGGAAAMAMTALVNPEAAAKKFDEGKPEYTQLQERAKDLNLKYVGVSKDNLKAAIETAENPKE